MYAWLKSKFGDKPIPRFEITARTLSTLYTLARLNASRDADVDFLIQDAAHYTEEYKQQGLQLQRVLDDVGIDTAQIEPRSSIHACTSAMVSLASTLQLKDTQNSSFFVGINELRQESDRLEQQQIAERQVLKDLMAKTTQVVQRIAELKRVLEQLEEQSLVAQHTTSTRSAQISYLSDKAAEYQETLDNSRKISVDPEITHEFLLAESSRLSELRTLTNHVNEVLASHKDLPPDISLAKLRIEEARAKLVVLEENLSSKLGGII